MKKLAIILGFALLLTAGCASGSSDKSNDWSASERADLRYGMEQEMESSDLNVSEATLNCVETYVTSRYSPDELLDKSMDEVYKVGYDAGIYCMSN